MRIIIFFVVSTMLLFSCTQKKENTLLSPDQKLRMEFILNEGKPAYKLSFNEKLLIDTSYLSFSFKNTTELSGNITILSTEIKSFDDEWEMPWGEQRFVRNNYNELFVELAEEAEPFRKFNIRFRLFNDGMGFRTEFPQQENWTEALIIAENTEFQLTTDPICWWIPGDWDIYEYLYQTSRLSAIDAKKFYIPGDHLGQTYVPENSVNTPITMKTDDDVYLSFHEADLTDYAGMTLRIDTANLKMTSSLVQSERFGYAVKRELPFHTPWRTVQVADRAGDLIESKMILNLNEPNKLGDVSWFKPTKYLGIWWEIHIGKSSFDMASGNHGATTENAKKYIDFASENGIHGLLVEGWNTGWENWTNEGNREGIFDFVTPYADYDLQEVVRYGKEKGVELIMHHETSAAVQTYLKQMDTAYFLMQDLGIHMVKSGYVGKLNTEGEYHHGQYMVNFYRHALEEAAKYKIAVNAHEPIKATGIRRTLPNAISREGLRGQEYNAWSADGGNPPEHLSIVAFTRMLAGPIDFTPGIFNIKLEPYKDFNQVNTTLAQQLALYVVIYSPIQMVADLPEHYKGNPAFQFIRDVGVDWEETKVLNGEPGDFVTIARKEKDSDNWFIGSISDENERTLKINLDFLDAGKSYKAILYLDGEDADWNMNPTSVKIEERMVNKESEIELYLAPGGGAAISIMPEKN
jgi:hypothetical protein